MSRRRHGRSRHAGRPRPDGVHLTDLQAPPAGPVVPPPAPSSPPSRPARPQGETDRLERHGGSAMPRPAPAAQDAPVEAGGRVALVEAPAGERQRAPQSSSGDGHASGSGCTAPQLRRFIKSRPYVPMHELRRRFGIDGADDDVTPVQLDDGRIYVGLPQREGALLGELLRGGEIGFELSLDPRTPIVVGVYPMRPVPRG